MTSVLAVKQFDLDSEISEGESLGSQDSYSANSSNQDNGSEIFVIHYPEKPVSALNLAESVLGLVDDHHSEVNIAIFKRDRTRLVEVCCCRYGNIGTRQIKLVRRPLRDGIDALWAKL